MRHDPAHPLAGKTGLVSEARASLFDRIGPGPHPCHHCGKPIDWFTGLQGNKPAAIIADHLNSNPLDDSAANVVPSCGKCNATRTQRIKPGEQMLTLPDGRRLRAVERTCVRCGTGFLIPPSTLNRPNKGLFCSRSCARSAPRDEG